MRLLALLVLLGVPVRLAAQDAGMPDAGVSDALAPEQAPATPDAATPAALATPVPPASTPATPVDASQPAPAEPYAASGAVAEGARTKKETLKKKKKKKKKKGKKREAGSHERPTSGLHMEARGETSGGGMSGYRERKEDFGFIRGAAVFEPTLRVGDLVLALPVGVAHRETIGASLSESRASFTFEARYRFSRAFRAYAFAGLQVVDRPNWPDLRQPTADGHLGTDRYSYGTRRVGGGVTVHPARRHWLRSSYEYRLADYDADPAFQPIEHPTHLAPFDHEKHLADLAYHYSTRRLRIGVGADGFIKHNFFWFSRDAHTGFTHAAPRGREPNPLQTLGRVVPRVDVKLKPLKNQLELYLRYAHELQEDPFQGYYSFSGPNPRIELRYSPVALLWLHAGAELWWRRYGAGSYRQGIGHPELDSGDRRHDHRVSTELGAKLSLGKVCALTLQGSYLLRETNFPDYEPGVFPPTRNYSIDWDYRNFRVEAGIEARFHSL